MNQPGRMSPWTALFIGAFGVGAVGIAAGASVVLYGMRIAEKNVAQVLGLAEDAVEGLPELIESLPPGLAELLNDRRAPEYASKLNVIVKFVPDARGQGWHPALIITNEGDEVVSLLGVRVAALDAHGAPLKEWTEVVATPLAIDDDWRGPLMPHNTRYVVLSRSGGVDPDLVAGITGAFEISEVRVWQPQNRSGGTEHTSPTR